jgi:hypothetical protein
VGVLVLLTSLILAILALLGLVGQVQTSATGRAYARIVDTRRAIEAGDSALMEAVVHLRRSLDTDRPTTACPDRWRTLLRQAVLESPRLPARRIVRPELARATFGVGPLRVSIGDVSVDVIDLVVPSPTGGVFSQPPQGILEMSVSVRGSHGLLDVSRTIRERRIVHATGAGGRLSLADLERGEFHFVLLSDPMGTVIE